MWVDACRWLVRWRRPFAGGKAVGGKLLRSSRAALRGAFAAPGAYAGAPRARLQPAPALAAPAVLGGEQGVARHSDALAVAECRGQRYQICDVRLRARAEGGGPRRLRLPLGASLTLRHDGDLLVSRGLRAGSRVRVKASQFRAM